MLSNKEVWILSEQKEGELEDITLELAVVGHRIADKSNNSLAAIVFGENGPKLIDRLAGYGVDKIIAINDTNLKGYTTEVYSDALADIIKVHSPEAVLCGATLFGSDIASGLAARLETGLIPDCYYLDVDGSGLLLGNASIYGGKIQATFLCPEGRPQIVTLKPESTNIKVPKAGRGIEVVSIETQYPANLRQTMVSGYIKVDLDTIRLDQAEIIVAGGRGIGSSEGFRTLEELAELLGGRVGASLVAVDNGWVSSDKQVGQTGTIVRPRLYLAVGISGSIYHMMGMKESRVIVAINRDRNAPIFKLADMGIVGGWEEIIKSVIKLLKQESS